jgi:hypothetical protein
MLINKIDPESIDATNCCILIYRRIDINSTIEHNFYIHNYHALVPARHNPAARLVMTRLIQFTATKDQE